jgi:hypothetical protein
MDEAAAEAMVRGVDWGVEEELAVKVEVVMGEVAADCGRAEKGHVSPRKGSQVGAFPSG